MFRRSLQQLQCTFTISISTLTKIYFYQFLQYTECIDTLQLYHGHFIAILSGTVVQKQTSEIKPKMRAQFPRKVKILFMNRVKEACQDFFSIWYEIQINIDLSNLTYSVSQYKGNFGTTVCLLCTHTRISHNYILFSH